jgi:hypothetical protein
VRKALLPFDQSSVMVCTKYLDIPELSEHLQECSQFVRVSSIVYREKHMMLECLCHIHTEYAMG